jgi:hypothetical protein
MATCRHKHLQLGEDGLYGCIVCGQPFVAEPAKVDVAPEPAEPSPPEPAAVAPEPPKAARKSAGVVASAPQKAEKPEVEPEVDVASQLRVYLAGKPREMPASARRRRKTKPL